MTIKVSKPAINLREKLNELDFDRVPFQKMPAGSVLQVVSSSLASAQSSTSTSYVSSTLSTTIAPKSSSSKILIEISGGQQYCSGGNRLYIALYKDGGSLDSPWACLEPASTIGLPHSATYLDSPSTTASITYTVYYYSHTGSVVYFQDGGGSFGEATLTLMEIAQ